MDELFKHALDHLQTDFTNKNAAPYVEADEGETLGPNVTVMTPRRTRANTKVGYKSSHVNEHLWGQKGTVILAGEQHQIARNWQSPWGTTGRVPYFVTVKIKEPLGEYGAATENYKIPSDMLVWEQPIDASLFPLPRNMSRTTQVKKKINLHAPLLGRTAPGTLANPYDLALGSARPVSLMRGVRRYNAPLPPRPPSPMGCAMCLD